MTGTSKKQIIKELDLVPQKKLGEIESYIRFILSQTNGTKKIEEPKSLSGIWKGKGFEKIFNIENEIRKSRKAIALNLLKKYE